MAGNISDYAENKILDHSLGTATFTKPTTVYIALFTTSPTDANSGSEVSGSNYSRQTITFNSASSGATANAGTITFPTASGSWGTITHFGLYDASTTGNLLWWGALTASQAIATGNILVVNAGDLTVSLD